MGLLCSLLALSLQFLLLLSSLLSSMLLTNCLPYVHNECHEDESYALLQFKQSFLISENASYNPSSYPKTQSWMPSTDCCSSWDGIECDEVTGNVIGIDLSSSQLYGSIDANSTIFSLVHLQSLDLSDNDFNGSQIPARIGELSKLTYLNLSHIWETTFSGEVPPEVSHLSNLLSLDLRSYIEYIPPNSVNNLQLNISTLRSLIQNTTYRLENICLDFVTISSSVPDILTNLTNLRRLHLSFCDLYGEFPVEMFHLPYLTFLNLGDNQNLKGMLPDFHLSAPPIDHLNLQNTSFYGPLPASIGNLSSLYWFSILNCNFSGSIPSSLGNLNQLFGLELGGNRFTSETLPSSFANLTQLSMLTLTDCNLVGEFPSWITNLTNLFWLSLDYNDLQGEIPHSLFRLGKLETLKLSFNSLQGQLKLDMFMKLKKLNILSLSHNKLTLLTEEGSSNVTTLPPLKVLALGACNLVELPIFLRDLDELEYLDLSYNDLRSLPSWMWRKRSLKSLYVFNNSLTGRIPPLICNLRSLVVLDLSFNNLSGTIPSCLGSFSQSLQALKLQGNKLVGLIPETYMIGSSLKMIDFSDNDLQGQLPRALANCKMLEFLDVSHNHINGSFPFWLGSLPELKVIALSYNEFYGAIVCPSRCTFPRIHIIDLSHNEFSGNLSPETIKNWKSMTASNTSQLRYEDNKLPLHGKYWYGAWDTYNYYSLTMSNKGVIMDYEKLQHLYNLITIDLSSNNISGEIPQVLGDLKGLVLLNLSNNMLTGSIPSSLGKLSNLEALDLSLNNLSGKIPQQLTELTFLEFFNVSFNNLSGRIPENKQFSTFQDNSFEGNQGLCGIQLSKKCEDPARPPLPVSDGDQESDTGSFFEFSWKVVLIGYGGGLAAGFVLGNIYSSVFIKWLKRFF